MSGLISSLIIDPVFRHARRFSRARQDDSARRPRTLVSARGRISGLEGASNSHAAAEGPSTLTQGPASIHDPQTQPSHAHGEVPVRASRATTEAAGPLPSTLTRAENAPRPLQHPGATSARDMSYNPSHGIPEPFRPMDSLNPRAPSERDVHDTGNESTPAAEEGGGVASGERGHADSPAPRGALPADDGMRLLRQKIHEIRDMKGSNEEKARRMHLLMTERYNLLHGHLRPQSPLSVVSLDRPSTPLSAHSAVDSDTNDSSPVSLSEAQDASNPYYISPGDTLPSYRPATPPKQEHEVEVEEDDDEDGPALGCVHYKRNVKIQCFDCRKWYPCRFCHDEVESHRLDRKKTRNMLCMLCATPQPAREVCANCSGRTAWYYCDICKLWDDDASKHIYHCPDCGICRRGEGLGKDYFHCKRCNVCIAISFASSHRCIERATDCDCPICGDYLFNSSASVVSMPCGHYIHRLCYDQYMTTAYKCPICKKSAVNMELQWQKIAHAIETQPMPAQFRDTKVLIHCNDCEGKSEVPYHWLGNKCSNCDSFNTNEVRLLDPDDERQDDIGYPTRPSPLPVTRSQRGFGARSPGSYFLSSPEGNANRSRPESADESLSAQVMQRVSRSLSPLRHYLNGPGGPLRTDIGRSDLEHHDEELDFWGADGGRILSGDDGDDDGTSSCSTSSDESVHEPDPGEEEDDDDGDEDDLLDGIQLIGHR